MGRREDRQWGGRRGLTIPMRYRERLKYMPTDRHQICQTRILALLPESLRPIY